MSLTEGLYELYRNSAGISTDTRTIKPGTLFFALSGPNFDGNQFADEALKKGAVAAVVEYNFGSPSSQYIQVQNVLKTRQSLASYHRNHFDIPVICITGSNGKTTTKELVFSVLSTKYKVHATKGNFNNLTGLPISILRMPINTQIAVFEIGSNAFGEISRLCEIAMPTHGLITNIGSAHLEGFENIEGVKKEKGSLYTYLAKTGGIGFVNLDEPHLESLAAGLEKTIYYFGSELKGTGSNAISISCDSLYPSIDYSFNIDGKHYDGSSSLFGLHNFRNICSVIALGRSFNLEGQQILDGIRAYQLSNNRSEVKYIGSNTIILDAYNANPTSMSSALKILKEWPSSGSKMAILGDMLELGVHAESQHDRIIKLLQEYDFDRVILVGEIFSKLGQHKFSVFPNIQALKSAFNLKDLQNSIVLLKGSRGIQLERLTRS